MKLKLPTWGQVRKAAINAAGLLASLLSLGLLPEPYAGIAATVIAVLTMVAHYQVPNDPMDPEPQTGAHDAPAPEPAPVPVTGTVVEPPTEEMAAVPPAPTASIPVVEGDDARNFGPAYPTVDDILSRLKAEGSPSV